jgi:DNA repair exonuclease SbcCD ATPase subunit
MRLLRLELENVRGVKDRTLVFAPDGATTGVVVVEGCNEAGKSTLGDALDALLAYKDSANRAEIRSLQTAGEDRAPVVEAELQVGVYRFVYRKQFLKQRSTTLHILEPREEQLSGDEAHERVEAILDEGIDRTLWSSLRLRQGDALTQADLGAAAGLANVLAGTGTGAGDTGVIGDRELGILETVRGEYLRYFTKSGKEGTLLRDARARVDTLRGELEALQARRRELEEDVELADKLERSLPTLVEKLTEAESRAGELAAAAERIDELARRVEECERRDEGAVERLAHLTDQRDRRADLVEELSRFEAERERSTEARREAEAARDEAAARYDAAMTQLEAAKSRRTDAHARREQAQGDLAHLQAVADREGLQARADRVVAASKRLGEAVATVASIAVDDRLLERVRTAQTAAVRTEVALDAASPALRFTAAAPVNVGAGDDRLDLAAGETREWTVRGRLTLQVGDLGEVEVRAGDGTEDAEDAHRRAREQLLEVLREAQVDDVEAAERAHRERLDAERAAEDARRELDVALGDRTIEELTEEVDRLGALIARSGEGRTGDRRLPADVAAARTALDEATAAAHAADDALALPEAELEAARELRETRRTSAGEARVRVETAAERARAAAEELEAARTRIADEVLAGQVADAEAACETARAELEAARSELQGAEPETVRSLRGNADAVVEDLRRDLEARRRDLRDARVRIQVQGGNGMHERCQAAEGELAYAQGELDGLLRRARAAGLLHERLSHHHARARERYAAPLREQLLAYGRMLYGNDFDVELDDDLRVQRRKHDGLWLDVAQLSVGAREQLALLGRLACATLLGDDGGLLLFDDALGNTDPDRLERIGAVLREAGDHSQIVVLTCYPDRYRHVGGATRLAL